MSFLSVGSEKFYILLCFVSCGALSPIYISDPLSELKTNENPGVIDAFRFFVWIYWYGNNKIIVLFYTLKIFYKLWPFYFIVAIVLHIYGGILIVIVW